jgi:hypothetical protein
MFLASLLARTPTPTMCPTSKADNRLDSVVLLYGQSIPAWCDTLTAPRCTSYCMCIAGPVVQVCVACMGHWQWFWGIYYIKLLCVWSVWSESWSESWW